MIGYCRRRIDRALKGLDFTDAKDVVTLAKLYSEKTSALDVQALAKCATDAIQNSITSKNIKDLLKWYDNKGNLNIAAKAKGIKADNFEQWIIRSMLNEKAPSVRDAIRSFLPSITAS